MKMFDKLEFRVGRGRQPMVNIHMVMNGHAYSSAVGSYSKVQVGRSNKYCDVIHEGILFQLVWWQFPVHHQRTIKVLNMMETSRSIT